MQTTGQTTGTLTHFLVEPFVPHQEEYYLAITTHREKDTVHFSLKGGVDIEEVWDTVKTVDVGIDADIDGTDFGAFLPPELGDKKATVAEFIKAMYKFLVDYHYTYLELNPFTFVGDKVVPLDTLK